MFLNEQWITEEIKRIILKFPETNGNTTYQNSWYRAKRVLSG